MYHSAESGPGQARYVFIAGNGLPQRWHGTRVFTVLETGFGFGLNFLETWRAWLDDPARPERLHYLAIEKHPFERSALQTLHARYPEVAKMTAALHAAWPPLVAGLHRLDFEGGRIALTLAFGDVSQVLPRLRLAADAIYLDGFAPDRNPQMWSLNVMKGLARLSRPGTTVATWSTAASVRASLCAAGFVLEKRAGFGRKREMLAGRYAPRGRRAGASATPHIEERSAIVIGAGLAGAAVTERLTARGWHIDLIDEHARPRRDAFCGIFHPHLSRDDCILSRATRSGFLYALARWIALERRGLALEWARCGVLQLPAYFRNEAWMAETIDALGLPPQLAQHVARERAEALAGTPLKSGGWWFPGAGWMNAGSLIAAQLDAAAAQSAFLKRHFEVRVHEIRRTGERWEALSDSGRVVASARALVLANANGAARFVDFSQPLKSVRGQITCIPSALVAAPRVVVTGSGYVLPERGGTVLAGSTYGGSDDPRPQAQSDQANLARVNEMLPGSVAAIDAAALRGAVGFRAVAPDRLPLAGAVANVETMRREKSALAGTHLPQLPRVTGLYCVTALASRGLTWAALCAEIVASALEGEPLPLESDLADALDPARFALRRLRSETL